MTGEINLLKKLPNKAKNEELETVWIGRFLAILFLLCSLTPCLLTAVLMDWIQQNDPLAVIVYTCMGPVIGGPLACICIGTMLQQQWHLRLSVLLMFVAMYIAALAIGLSISDFPFVAGRLVAAVPILVLAASLPFLAVRHYRDWQIVFEQLGDSSIRQSLSVAGLMISTAIVGFCVVATQMCDEPELVVICATVVAGISFIVFLPIFGYVMRTKHPVLAIFVCYGIGLVVGGLVLSVCDQVFSWRSQADELLGFAHAVGMGILVYSLGICSCRLLGGKLLDRNHLGV